MNTTAKLSVISDMDGVIYRSKKLIAGALKFVQNLKSRGTSFLFLTNNSEQTPLDLSRKLSSMGLEGVSPDNFVTASEVTAHFLSRYHKGGSVFVIGGAALTSALYQAGFSITESNPDYVVVGKTSNYNYELIRKASRLIEKGARFIATNPDLVDPAEEGLEPACGALIAPIEVATGKKPYIVGKPNPIMMSYAIKKLNSLPWETVMIGDRMDTDILCGMEAGLKTCLTFSGVTRKEDLEKFPFRPDYLFADVGEIDLDKIERELHGN